MMKYIMDIGKTVRRGTKETLANALDEVYPLRLIFEKDGKLFYATCANNVCVVSSEGDTEKVIFNPPVKEKDSIFRLVYFGDANDDYHDIVERMMKNLEEDGRMLVRDISIDKNIVQDCQKMVLNRWGEVFAVYSDTDKIKDLIQYLYDTVDILNKYWDDLLREGEAVNQRITACKKSVNIFKDNLDMLIYKCISEYGKNIKKFEEMYNEQRNEIDRTIVRIKNFCSELGKSEKLIVEGKKIVTNIGKKEEIKNLQEKSTSIKRKFYNKTVVDAILAQGYSVKYDLCAVEEGLVEEFDKAVKVVRETKKCNKNKIIQMKIGLQTRLISEVSIPLNKADVRAKTFVKASTTNE